MHFGLRFVRILDDAGICEKRNRKGAVMKKRTIEMLTVLLALLMLSTCLVGCGGSKSSDYADVLTSPLRTLISISR